MAKANKDERIATVAEQVMNLLAFSSLLVPELEILEQVARKSNDIQSHVQAMAPVLGAVGLDYEEKDMQANINRKRAQALYELVKVIKETEEERVAFKKSQVTKNNARDQIASALGMK